jgi:hypothetical protein
MMVSGKQLQAVQVQLAYIDTVPASASVCADSVWQQHQSMLGKGTLRYTHDSASHFQQLSVAFEVVAGCQATALHYIYIYMYIYISVYVHQCSTCRQIHSVKRLLKQCCCS